MAWANRVSRQPFRKTTVHELSHRMLEIAGAGLKRRAVLDSGGMSEDGFLNPLRRAGEPAAIPAPRKC